MTAPADAGAVTPFQRLAMVCPLARVRCTVHPFTAADPLLATTTLAWKPPGQELVSW